MSTAADFSATLVDEWARAGVRHAVVCPGSRSSPLAIALLGQDVVECHVRLDERSAGFFALGSALASGRPTVLVTTSGTAAAEIHPAVLEADLAGVPLVVCTADRPPELHGVGAPQTVRQTGLYGRAVRFVADPGVPDESMRATWRSLASRVVAESLAGPAGPGPVHLNLAFREPLGTDGGEVTPGRSSRGIAPWHAVVRAPEAGDDAVDALLAHVAGVERGIVVAGAGSAGSAGSGSRAAFALARRLRWPVLADPRAWPRSPELELVAAADSILRRADVAARLRPDVVVHLGAPAASKVLASWHAATAGLGTTHVLVDPYGRFADPDRVASVVLAADPALLCARAERRLELDAGRPRPGASSGSPWLAEWLDAERRAQGAIDAVLDGHRELTEPGLARELYRVLPDGATLVVSSSMPVRDVECFAAPRAGAPTVLANRGANGIDGVTSTALGAAAGLERSEERVVCLLGDLAFLHDVSGLVWGAREHCPDATLVVVDNAGGGIFDFLAYAEALDDETFQRGFGTPQACDVAAIARAFGCGVHPVEHLGELGPALEAAARSRGIQVVHVRTERRRNVAFHAELQLAVAEAVDGAG